MANKYALTHDTEYSLMDMWYAGSMMDGNGSSCDNCGKLITNMAEVKDLKSGKQYIVGQDCAETLTGIGKTEEWENRKYTMRQAKRIYDFYLKVKKNGTLDIYADKHAVWINGQLPKKTIIGGKPFDYMKSYTETFFRFYLEMLPKSFTKEIEQWKKQSSMTNQSC
jgi:hypothetical protein